MEDQQIADQIVGIITELMQVAGPEQTLEFLQGGLEAAQQGGETGEPDMMQEPPMMSQPRPMGNAFAQG